MIISDEHVVTIRKALETAYFEAEHAIMYDEKTDMSWMGDADALEHISAAIAAIQSDVYDDGSEEKDYIGSVNWKGWKVDLYQGEEGESD